MCNVIKNRVCEDVLFLIQDFLCAPHPCHDRWKQCMRQIESDYDRKHSISFTLSFTLSDLYRDGLFQHAYLHIPISIISHTPNV